MNYDGLPQYQPTKRKVFISFHQKDRVEVDAFIDQWATRQGVFIAKALYETLQLEIITVLESLNRLRESPEYELCQISERKPGVLDELAAERAKLLEKESAELRHQADKLAEEIKELSGVEPSKIA